MPLEELMDIFELVQIQDTEDIVTWALELSGKFSSRSLYRLMTNPGEVDTRVKEMWEVKIPLKIKIFLWMLWHDRVQIGEELVRLSVSVRAYQSANSVFLS